MGEYRAVIFDFGGVLTTSPMQTMRAFCEQHGLSWDQIGPIIGSHEGAWSRYETSALSEEEFVKTFEEECDAAGCGMDAARFLAHFRAGTTLREDMIAVVRSIRQWLKVGCITNNFQSSGRRRAVEFEALFDVVVESSKEGIRKPDPRIYLIACERLGVKPEEAVFLDDLGVNLKAARALGMATIKVDDTQGAIDELEQLLGFDLPREGQSAIGSRQS